MNYSKGPWSACNDGKCRCKQIWSKAEDHPVATVISGEWGDEYPSVRLIGGSLERKAEAYMEKITYGEISEEMAKANARLIAAAPDLLEACKLSAEHLKDFLADEIHHPIHDCPVLNAVEKAIAKAEGRQP